MSALVVLNSKANRERAARWVMSAKDGVRVEFHEPRRTLPQNERMHAMLTDIARQCTHHGVKLGKDDWKLLFLDALKREMRLVPNLDGTGLVPLSGRSSSKLTVAEMSDMIEMIAAYGAEHDVVFTDEPRRDAA